MGLQVSHWMLQSLMVIQKTLTLQSWRKDKHLYYSYKISSGIYLSIIKKYKISSGIKFQVEFYGFFFLLQLVNQYYTKEYYTNLVLVQIFIENVFKRPRKYDVYKAMITRTSTHVASFLAKMLPLLQKSLIKTRF